jgi:hypothetical protein
VYWCIVRHISCWHGINCKCRAIVIKPWGNRADKLLRYTLCRNFKCHWRQIALSKRCLCNRFIILSYGSEIYNSSQHLHKTMYNNLRYTMLDALWECSGNSIYRRPVACTERKIKVVTDNNRFWIEWLNLLLTPYTICRNYNQLQANTINLQPNSSSLTA